MGLVCCVHQSCHYLSIFLSLKTSGVRCQMHTWVCTEQVLLLSGNSWRPGPKVSSKHTERRKSDQCWDLQGHQSLAGGVWLQTQICPLEQRRSWARYTDLTADRWPHKLIHPLTLGSGVSVPVVSVDKVFSGPGTARSSLLSPALLVYCAPVVHSHS